jgi:hypothetical protein
MRVLLSRGHLVPWPYVYFPGGVKTENGSLCYFPPLLYSPLPLSLFLSLLKQRFWEFGVEFLTE